MVLIEAAKKYNGADDFINSIIDNISPQEKLSADE